MEPDSPIGKLIYEGFQKSASNAAQPTGIVMGANLNESSKPSSTVQKEKKKSPSTKPRDTMQELMDKGLTEEQAARVISDAFM